MKLSLIVCLLLFVQPVFAQNFGAQEPFHLINIGNGAAALGMGGAYVAVAEDLSAIAWNPAGLSHQTGLRLQFDSLYTTGSEEFEVHTNQTGTTLQDYSVHGFQPQSLALTYQMTRGNFIFGPAFGWSRSGLYLDAYEMKDPINGPFTSPIFFAEGTYTYESGRTYHRSGEDIYSFGFSLKLPKRVAIGGVWNLLGGELTQDLFIQNSQQGTQIFFPPDEEPVFGSFSSHRSFVQTTTEKISGNYVNLGILYEYHPKFSFGGAIRFGYTRKREITEFSKVDFDFTGMVTSSYHLESEFGPITIESELPIEFSGGVAIRLTPRIRVASSLTYADYSPTNKVNSFPTFRGDLGFQSNLIQWRNGLEYQLRDAFLIRGGWILDDQPYSKEFYPVNEPHDSPFYGYTFGAGWHSNRLGFDAAFLHENGGAFFGARLGGISDHDVEFSDGHLSHNRLFFTVNFWQ